MKTESAFLFNLWEIPRADLPSMFVEFYAGDILSHYSDALIISSFRGDYFPVPGSIHGALAERFGLQYGDTLPEGTLSVHPNLHRFPAPKCGAFTELWVLEIREVLDSAPITQSDVSRVFRLLKDHIRDFVKGGARSISLPLIGTGYLGLPLQEVVYETLQLIRGWSNTVPPIEVVRVFAYELEKVAILNRTIDLVLGFTGPETSNALLAAANEELEQKFQSFNAEVAEILRTMSQLAHVDYPSAKSIAVEGRKLAEACTKMLFRTVKPDASFPGKLSGLINEVEPLIKQSDQQWILNYLRLLQTCGNNAAHPANVNVNLTDAAAIVVAAIRVAEFTQQQM